MAVQKRTYTRWMNVFLKRCDPPLEVQDLFVDVWDGRVLLALLEELSGCKLVYRFRPSTHRIFRLNNIAKALAFLDDRHVKLLGIDATGVADGIPQVVLRLIWNVISFFQIKEANGGLRRRLSSSLSSLPAVSSPSPRDLSPSPPYSCCTLPRKRRRPALDPQFRSKPMKTLLLWVQRRTSSLGVEVVDFGKSWRSGLAFLALIKSIEPGLVDLRAGRSREPQQNLELAFRIARKSLGIPALLEPQDVACSSPDERSVVTYLSMFLEYPSEADEDITADIGMRPNVSDIQDSSPVEPEVFRETFAPQPETETEAFLHTLGDSSEQLLWQRWSRRSSGEPRPSRHQLRRTSSSQRSTGEAFSPPSNRKGILPSGLSVGPGNDGAGQGEALAWMQESSEDHHVLKSSHINLCLDQGKLSQSSEDDGLYMLSVLDSDEEDAYSYILDLQREHQQSDDAANRSGRRRTSWRRGKGSDGSDGSMPDTGFLETAGAAPQTMRAEDGETAVEQTKSAEKIDDGGEEGEDGGVGLMLRAAPRDESYVAKGGDAGRWSSTAERPASDSVFREGEERVTEEIAAFRGRFEGVVTSSTAEERSPRRASHRSDAGERTAEMAVDAGLGKHAKAEISPGGYEFVTGQSQTRATVEKSVGMLSERNAGTKATRLDVDGELRIRTANSSSLEGETQEVLSHRAAHAPLQSVGSHRSTSRPEQRRAAGASLQRWEEETRRSTQTPGRTASSRPALSQKGAAASSCDVSGTELQVLIGLWMLLFCYFLFPQIHL